MSVDEASLIVKPAGVKVLPVPTFFVSKVCVGATSTASPAAKAPTVEDANEVTPPS